MGLINWPTEQPTLPINHSGWMEPETIKTIERLGQTYNFETILEIGTYTGLSTRLFLNNFPDAKMYSVDTWTEDWRIMWDADPQAKEQCIANLWEYRDRLTLYQYTSLQMMNLLHDDEIFPSMIFIDGDHSYAGVFGDVDCCLTLFPQSFIWGHDYTWESVLCSLTDVTNKWNVSYQGENNTWFLTNN